MKKLIVFIGALLGVMQAVLAQPDTVWTRAYGTAGVEWGYGVTVAPGGDHLFTGLVAHETNDILVVRTDGSGTQVWQRSYGQGANEIGRAIGATADGGMIVAASSAPLGGNADFQIMKMNFDGDVVWTRTLGRLDGNEEPTCLLINEDQTIFVAGNDRASITAPSQIFVALLSANGDTLWTNRYFGGAASASVRSVARTDDGYVLAGAGIQTGASLADMFVMRISATGAMHWAHYYGDPDLTEFAVGIGRAGDDFLLGGQTSVQGPGGSDFRALRISGEGAQIWTRTYVTQQAELAGGAGVTTDQGIVIGGHQSTQSNGFDVLMIKYTQSGGFAWLSRNGGTQNDFCENLFATADGGIVTVGMTRSFGAGETDIYGVRLSGLAGVTGVVTNRMNGEPLGGVRLSALGIFNSTTTDRLGRYTLAVPPGTATITLSGNCIEPDSILNVIVLQDSFHVLNASVLLPQVVFNQSSINIVAPNHGVASQPLHIGNTGDGQLYYSVIPQAISPRSTWLTAIPSSGVLNPDEEINVMITVDTDTSNIGVFDYYGALTVHVNSCPDSVFHVDVTATIVNAADDLPVELPTDLALAAFPNPFNPATSLQMDIPRSGQVTLDIYDVQGRLLTRLFAGTLTAGRHHIHFDGSAFASGVYFAEATTTAGTVFTKLLLLK